MCRLLLASIFNVRSGCSFGFVWFSSAFCVKTSVKTLLSQNYSPPRRYKGVGRRVLRGRTHNQNGSALKSSPDPKGKLVGSLEIEQSLRKGNQKSDGYLVNGGSPEVFCDATNVHSASSSSTAAYQEAKIHPLQVQYGKLSIDSDEGVKSSCKHVDTSLRKTISSCDQIMMPALKGSQDSEPPVLVKDDPLGVDPLLLDVMDHILSLLPMNEVLGLRSKLGRALKDAIHRPAFRENRPSSEAEYGPSFFTTDSELGDMHWHGFDINLRKWSRLPSLNFAKPTLPSPDPDLFKDYLVAGDGGLLCIYVGKASGREKLVMCNPLTQQVKVLPPLTYPRHPVLMHLKVDHDTGHYKVIVVGSAAIGTEELSLKTEEYDSRKGEWEYPVGSDLPCPAFGLNEYQNGVYFKDSERELLMCVAIIDTRGRGVLVYDITKKKWAQGPHIPLVRSEPNVSHLATTQIVECGGSVFVFSEQECGRDVHFLIHKLIPEVSGDFTWEEVMKHKRTGGRGLLVYPEFTCVPVSEHELCIFNTVEHTMEMIDLSYPTEVAPLQSAPISKGNRFHSLNPIGFVFRLNFGSVVCPRGRNPELRCDFKLQICSECEGRESSNLFVNKGYVEEAAAQRAHTSADCVENDMSVEFGGLEKSHKKSTKNPNVGPMTKTGNSRTGRMENGNFKTARMENENVKISSDRADSNIVY